MNKFVKASTIFALMLLVAAVTFTITYSEFKNSVNNQLEVDAQKQQEISKYLEVKDYIKEYYVGDYDEEKLMDSSLQGMVRGLGDRWSYYLSAEEYKAYQLASENQYVGIGLTAAFDEEKQALLITSVIEGSPAKEAGLSVFEMITAVDGESVSKLGYEVAVSRIKGEENTKVNLEITNEQGTVRTVEVTRKTVQQEAVHSEILSGNIGYVRISNFEGGVSEEFEQSVQQLINADISGLIFDVRINPGGKLQELIPMLDMLLPAGRIFTSRDKEGKEEKYDSDANEVTVPMAVIVDKYSYSAAEFFAAALQEYGKAEIVGQATTGKGYAQVPIELADGSALVLSVTEYYTPKGKSLANVGIKPDYEVIMTDEELSGFPSIPRDKDKQFQKAVEVVTDLIKKSEEEPAASAAS
jgi:carboxyl-terminal processing protease